MEAKMKMIDRFKATRRAGAPLAVITSAEPQSTMRSIYENVVKSSEAKFVIGQQ